MNCSEYSTENQEKEDKLKEEEETKEPVVEGKPKTKSSQSKEETPVSMASVFALLDIYLTKMLVSRRRSVTH